MYKGPSENDLMLNSAMNELFNTACFRMMAILAQRVKNVK